MGRIGVDQKRDLAMISPAAIRPKVAALKLGFAMGRLSPLLLEIGISSCLLIKIHASSKFVCVALAPVVPS